MLQWRFPGRTDFALAAILGLAATVRYWGLGFGLPDIDARPDETTVMNVAMAFFTGDPNPHFFNYPTLYMYCLFGVYLCCYAWALAGGELASVPAFLSRYAADPGGFVLADRAISALAGTATVYVVYRVASKLADRRTALVASLFLALAHLAVRDSHFGVADTAATLLVMCSVLLILESLDDASSKKHILAGAFSGLAAAAKYAGVLLVLPMAIAHVFRSLDGRRAGIVSPRRLCLLLFSGALLFAFLAGCPFALLDFHRFAADLAAEAHHLRLGHRIDLGPGWPYHLQFTLPIGLGRTLFLAGVAGIPVLIRRAPRKAIVLLSFPLAYYGLAGSGHTVFLRYMLPVVPFLCVTGAVCTTAAADLLSRRLPLPSALAVALVAALVILPSARKVLLTDRLLATKDSRLLATEWARREIPPGSSVFLAGPIWRDQRADPALGRLRAAYGISDSVSSPVSPGMTSVSDPVLTYDLWTYNQASRRFEAAGRVQRGIPDYIFLRESPLLAIGGTPAALTEIVATSYRLRASFHAIDMGRDQHWFDMQDGFFVPFAGFAGVERPGPNIYVYQRRRGRPDNRESRSSSSGR